MSQQAAAAALAGIDKLRYNPKTGEIGLKGLRAPATTATTGGDIQVELTLKDLKAPHALDLVTSGGNININKTVSH